jgi:large subunit ribosomal protein L4
VTPLPLLDADGVTVGRAAVAEAIAAQPIKQHLIHETVVAELAARRAASASTLTRGKVRGGGAKPWRQKGTGRARQGSIRAPQWTGGGVVFGPQPRSYGGKVNRKVRQQAFRAALRAQADRGTAALMDPTGWETPSTKRAAEYLRQASDALGERPLLLVVEDLDSVEARSFRNLAGVTVLAAAELETVDVVAARAILIERAVWERLAGGPAEVEAVEPKRKPKPRKKAKPKTTPKTVAPPPEPEPEAAPEPEPEAAPEPEPEAAAEPEPEAAAEPEPEAAAEPEAAEAAVVEEPAPAEPEAPVEEEPAPEEPAAEDEPEPVAEEPVGEEEPAPTPKPRAKKPAAKKPAARKPAAKKPAARKPPAKPAAEADGEDS